jgi:hypothetical protein
VLLGVVSAEGRVDFLAERMPVDAKFVETAKRGRAPEQRFRFSSPCLKRGCDKWNGSGCGVAGILHEQAPDLLRPLAASPLPRCSIRQQCRWHAEYGESICHACSWVITERGGGLQELVERAQAEI